MNLVLKSFSQDVDLSQPDNVRYYLVFENTKTGKQVRLPVQKETTEALVMELYGDSGSGHAEEDLQDEPEEREGVEFGGDFGEEGQDYGLAYVVEDDDDESDGPQSEDEVPSL